MTDFDLYLDSNGLPGSESGRIGLLLGLAEEPLDDIRLADHVSEGLHPSAAEELAGLVGRGHIVGPLIPEATLRRARKGGTPLSREMSERLYEVSRVVDAVSRTYHGDRAAITRFLERPHRLLGGRTPMQMAQSSSAGAEAVINLLRRAEAGFAV